MLVIVAGSSVQTVDQTVKEYRANGVNVVAAYDFRGLREMIIANDGEHIEIELVPELKDKTPERKKGYRLGYSPAPCRSAACVETLKFPSKRRFT